jgi:hypothetical protein
VLLAALLHQRQREITDTLVELLRACRQTLRPGKTAYRVACSRFSMNATAAAWTNVWDDVTVAS